MNIVDTHGWIIIHQWKKTTFDNAKTVLTKAQKLISDTL